jgi:hypothetical protein
MDMALFAFMVVPRIMRGARITNRNYTVRQTITATAIFHDCTFLNCRAASVNYPDYRGGALCLGGYIFDKCALSLGLAGCLFEGCHASYSGAVYAGLCDSFSMNRTSALACSARCDYAFARVQLRSTASGSLEIRESSAISCTCNDCALSLDCQSHSSGSTTRAESLNSSANRASARGSGICAAGHFGLSLHFCIFSRNVPANCLYFGDAILNGDLDCLAVFDNSCRSHSLHPGLIHVLSSLTLLNSVFYSNTFDFFLATESSREMFDDFRDSDDETFCAETIDHETIDDDAADCIIGESASRAVRIALVGCIFDVQLPPVAPAVFVSMTDCTQVDADLQVPPDRCSWNISVPLADAAGSSVGAWEWSADRQSSLLIWTAVAGSILLFIWALRDRGDVGEKLIAAEGIDFGRGNADDVGDGSVAVGRRVPLRLADGE